MDIQVDWYNNCICILFIFEASAADVSAVAASVSAPAAVVGCALFARSSDAVGLRSNADASAAAWGTKWTRQKQEECSPGSAAVVFVRGSKRR